MFITFLLRRFMKANAMARVLHSGVIYDIHDELSHRDLSGHDLSDRRDLDGAVLYNSCLSSEVRDAPILPAGLIGCTFILCNLDNVFVPDGNLVIDCSQRRFAVQNDLHDWIVDDTNAPVEPVNNTLFARERLSIDPRDIPAQKAVVDVITAERNRKADELQAAIDMVIPEKEAADAVVGGGALAKDGT